MLARGRATGVVHVERMLLRLAELRGQEQEQPSAVAEGAAVLAGPPTGSVHRPRSVRIKEFSCGDVVPGCRRVLRAGSYAGLLGEVGRHAQADHVSPALAAGAGKVRRRIRPGAR